MPRDQPRALDPVVSPARHSLEPAECARRTSPRLPVRDPLSVARCPAPYPVTHATCASRGQRHLGIRSEYAVPMRSGVARHLRSVQTYAATSLLAVAAFASCRAYNRDDYARALD